MHTASIIDTPPTIPGAASIRLAPAGTAVLLNANAKQVNIKLIRALQTRVGQEDVFVSSTLDEARQHVETIVSKAYGTLMIGGGDGTISATLQLLAAHASRPPAGDEDPSPRIPDLVILKLGTGNALASLVAAGRPLEDVERVLSNGTAEVSTLRVLERPGKGQVFPFASLGYDAQVLNDYTEVLDRTKNPVARRLAKSLGGYVYAVATRTLAAEIRRPTSRFRIRTHGRASLIDPESGEEIPLEVDSTLFEGVARAILVGTTPYYGFGMKVLPHAERRLDRFHLRVSTASIPYVLMHLPSIWKGTLRTPSFLDFLVEDVSITSNQALPLQLSGDAGGAVEELRVRLSGQNFRLLHLH